MSLAITTERGKISAQDQHDALEIVFRDSEWSYKEFRNDKPSMVDAMIYREFLEAVVEVKARDFGINQLRSTFKNEWLVSAHKIDSMMAASALLCVPGYFILYMKPDRMCMMVKVTEESGLPCRKYRMEETWTQATCNGGKALRVNAFIDMEDAKIYK